MPIAPPTFRPRKTALQIKEDERRRQEWLEKQKQRKAEIDAKRGSAAKRGYGRRWRKIRKAVLASEPLCRFCKDMGKIVGAEVVDHIDGNTANNDWDNLRPLCKSCHDRRTARDQAFGRKG